MKNKPLTKKIHLNKVVLNEKIVERMKNIAVSAENKLTPLILFECDDELEDQIMLIMMNSTRKIMMRKILGKV